MLRFARRLGPMALLLGAACASDEPAPLVATAPSLRTVQGQVLISPRDPALRVRVDDAYAFAGTQTFDLYGVARAEQFFFVNADAEGRVGRMYWFQFEAYLPDNEYTYDYPVTRAVEDGGTWFIADHDARNVAGDCERPDSDLCLATRFLESRGYRMASDEVLSERLVHLIDKTCRAELMIVYAEAAPPGVTSAGLAEASGAEP